MIAVMMSEQDVDTLIRMAAFKHARRLAEIHDHLTATELKSGFVFAGERVSLVTRSAALSRAARFGTRPARSASSECSLCGHFRRSECLGIPIIEKRHRKVPTCGRATSDRLQSLVMLGQQLDTDRVASSNFAASQGDTHDTGLTD